jgi:hypothetical protein
MMCKRHAVDLDVFAQDVAGGAGDRRDDGGVMAGERIQQTGLAGIGLAGDDDGHAFAQHAALIRAGAQRDELFL